MLITVDVEILLSSYCHLEGRLVTLSLACFRHLASKLCSMSRTIGPSIRPWISCQGCLGPEEGHILCGYPFFSFNLARGR
jgi:hypothetical protein